METKTQDKLFHTTAGVIIGILLSLGGLAFTHGLWMPDPIVIDKVATKTVVKEVPVIKEKVVNVPAAPAPVAATPLPATKWKATVTDADGNVKEYIVNKVKYIIVGAVLTQLDGTEVQVDGDDLKVERID